MPQVEIYDLSRRRVGELSLSGEVFEAPVREDLIQFVVRGQLAASRSGTASAKTRSEVSGGGAKPWKQKGSGRARHGSIRSPIWRKGGAAFGPKPKDWSFKVSRKVRRQALRSALSVKFRDGSLTVVKDLVLPEIKTKQVAEILRIFGFSRVLFVDASAGEWRNFAQSAGNIPHVKVLTDGGVNVYDTLGFDALVMTVDAVKSVQEGFAN